MVGTYRREGHAAAERAPALRRATGRADGRARPGGWAQRHRGQRGVIAMMAALTLTALLLLGIGTVSLGLLYSRDMEAQQAADTAAATAALFSQVQPWPMQGTGSAGANLMNVLQANNGGISSQIDDPPPLLGDPFFGGSSPVNLFTTTVGYGAGQYAWQPISPIFPVPAHNVVHVAPMVVNQLTWSNGQLEPKLVPLILVLDYSGSADAPDSSTGTTPHQWIVNAVQDLTNPTLVPGLNADRVDLGIVRFSSTVMPTPVPPVGWPQSSEVKQPGSAALVKQQRRLAVLNEAKQPADHTPGITGTSIVAALTQAVQMIANIRQGLQQQRHTAEGAILIMTDGELSAGAGDPVANPGQYCSQCAQNATAAQAVVAQAAAQGIQVTAFKVIRDSSVPSQCPGLADNTIAMLNSGAYLSNPANTISVRSQADIANMLSLLVPENRCLTDRLVPTPQNQGWTGAPLHVSEQVWGYYTPAGGSENNVLRHSNVNQFDWVPPASAQSAAVNTSPANYRMFYWQDAENIIELNDSVCIDYLNNNKRGTFQVRWGYPQPLLSTPPH